MPIKSLFFFSISKKRAYHWASSLYPLLATSFPILPAWPPLARYLFLLFIFPTDPSVYFPSQRDRPEPVCAGNAISIRLIAVKSFLQNSSFLRFDFLKKKSLVLFIFPHQFRCHFLRIVIARRRSGSQDCCRNFSLRIAVKLGRVEECLFLLCIPCFCSEAVFIQWHRLQQSSSERIDGKWWGFVAALISNMESAALGSQSLHPPSLLCDSRPPSLSFLTWL